MVPVASSAPSMEHIPRSKTMKTMKKYFSLIWVDLFLYNYPFKIRVLRVTKIDNLELIFDFIADKIFNF